MRWWFIVILCLVLQISHQADKEKEEDGKRGSGNTRKGGGIPQSQSTSRRTTRPPRRSFFSLLSDFFRETVADANKAARNISAIVNENFPSTPPNGTAEAQADFLSFQNVTDILSKNYRSLRRLFSSEWSNAIRDSRKNIQRYRKELQMAIRPYIYPSSRRNATST